MGHSCLTIEKHMRQWCDTPWHTWLALSNAVSKHNLYLARDEYLSAEVGRIRQQMESAGVKAAASQQSAFEQMQALHSWANTSLEALQARSLIGRLVTGDHVGHDSALVMFVFMSRWSCSEAWSRRSTARTIFSSGSQPG